MLNITYVALTLKSSPCVCVLYLHLGEHIVVSNDCITDTMRYSDQSAGLIFGIKIWVKLKLHSMLKLSQGLKAILKPEQVQLTCKPTSRTLHSPLTHKFWPPKTITERCRCSIWFSCNIYQLSFTIGRVRWTGSGINSFICNSNWTMRVTRQTMQSVICVCIWLWADEGLISQISDLGGIRLHSLTTCQPLCHSTNNPVHPLHYSLSTSPNDIWHMENPLHLQVPQMHEQPQNSFHGPPLQAKPTIDFKTFKGIHLDFLDFHCFLWANLVQSLILLSFPAPQYCLLFAFM